NKTSSTIEKGPSGVPRINRRIGLNHASNGTASRGINLTPQGADNPRRQCLVETKGIANSKHALSYFEIGRSANGQRSQLRFWRINVQHSYVMIRRCTNQSSIPHGMIS